MHTTRVTGSRRVRFRIHIGIQRWGLLHLLLHTLDIVVTFVRYYCPLRLCLDETQADVHQLLLTLVDMNLTRRLPVYEAGLQAHSHQATHDLRLLTSPL